MKDCYHCVCYNRRAAKERFVAGRPYFAWEVCDCRHDDPGTTCPDFALRPGTKTVIATLHDTRTGQTGTYSEHCNVDMEDAAIRYMWTAGNMACDCNRSCSLHPEDELDCNHGPNVIELLRLQVDGRDIGLEEDDCPW